MCFSPEAMSDTCVICKEEISSEDDIVSVGDKGRKTLVIASSKRGDELQQVLETAPPLILHTSCHKNYTRKKKHNFGQKKCI